MLYQFLQPYRMTYRQQKGRGCGHVTVCRDAARRAGLSATAELY